MATKKKPTWPKVEHGSHLTVTTYENGYKELKWDWEALTRDVQAALASVKKPAKKATNKTVAAKKHTRKSLSALTKLQLEEIGRGFGVELDRRKKKDDLVEEVMKAQRKANK